MGESQKFKFSTIWALILFNNYCNVATVLELHFSLLL